MILSVSRRTDIPAFYSDWFYNRIKAGFVDVRNPMNIHQISRINIKPDVTDCIVFWTKNPMPMISRMEELCNYNFYFQFTINPYNKEIERQVPEKKSIIEVFQLLSNKIGANKLIWRYDPILLTDYIDILYHIKYFEEIAKRLQGSTYRCVISFVDLYKKTAMNTKHLNMRVPSSQEIQILATELSNIAKRYGIEVHSCAEDLDLDFAGIRHGCCIDPTLIEEICGYPIETKKDKNQRKECGCIESIDIGAYNTCLHECSYCYANFNCQRVFQRSSLHIPTSSLLIGEIAENDKITERKVKLLKQVSLF